MVHLLPRAFHPAMTEPGICPVVWPHSPHAIGARPRRSLMIRKPLTLTDTEHRVLTTFVSRLFEPGWPPLYRAFLFGSKARGDDDLASDIDLLLLFDLPTEARGTIASRLGKRARRLDARTGVLIEPWAVPIADLVEGGRTPMLIDALEDSVPLWPIDTHPIRLPFTPADAIFCAERLLEWIEEGGAIIRSALRLGHVHAAARRARDDITRAATAALLLDGETRHRRIGSLRRFEARFVRTRRISPDVTAALAWAEAAFPPDGGRGENRPRITSHAAATASTGELLARRMRRLVEPYLYRRILEIERTMAYTRGAHLPDALGTWSPPLWSLPLTRGAGSLRPARLDSGGAGSPRHGRARGVGP